MKGRDKRKHEFRVSFRISKNRPYCVPGFSQAPKLLFTLEISSILSLAEL